MKGPPRSSPRGLALVLLLQQAAFWALTLTAHPWSTAGLECVVGAIAEAGVREPGWAVLDAAPGAVGGGVVAALAAMPAVLLGVGTGTGIEVAAALAAALVTLWVHRVARRAVGPGTASIVAAAAAFPAPLVLHTLLVAGNWHWTQLVFDWGACLLSLRLVERPTPWRAAALGALSTLGLYNSPASLPFVALAVLVAFVFARPPRRGPVLVAGVAGAVPFLLWLLASLSHRPLGATISTAAKDPILARLMAVRFDPGRLPGLLHPELPWALHLQDLHPTLPAGPLWVLAEAWTFIAWAGVLALAVLGLRAAFDRRGTALPLLLPVAFVAIWVLAYLLVATRLDLVRPLWSEPRIESHRAISTLVAVLGAGGALGWGAVAAVLEGRASRFARAGRAASLVLAAFPALVGALAVAALLLAWPLRPSLPDRPATCFDAIAIFAVQRGADPPTVRTRCDVLSSAERRSDCRLGAAIGVGYEAASLGPAPGRPQGPVHGGPCDRLPPDFRPRCLPWIQGDAPAFQAKTHDACAVLSGEERTGCWIGAGWFASQLRWGQDGWPLPVCRALSPEDRDACLIGVGFELGDHMSAVPWRMRPLLALVPPDDRPGVARGIGFALSRGRVLESQANRLCSVLGPSWARSCTEGARIGARLRGE